MAAILRKPLHPIAVIVNVSTAIKNTLAPVNLDFPGMVGGVAVHAVTPCIIDTPMGKMCAYPARLVVSRWKMINFK
jgi:hypothetical protein